ncbi:MAG: hypothetical protein ACYCWW_07945 [Deltaproteobacteria bacterium]
MLATGIAGKLNRGKESEREAPMKMRQNPAAATGTATVADKRRPWKWSKRQREAFRLTCAGVPLGRIAEQLGVDRHTIRRWWDAPEFQDKARTTLGEHAGSMMFRHRHQSELVGEIAFTVVKQLGAEVLRGKGPDPTTARKLIEASRSLIEAQRAEREVVEAQVALMERRMFRTRAKADDGESSFRRSLKENRPIGPLTEPASEMVEPAVEPSGRD